MQTGFEYNFSLVPRPLPLRKCPLFVHARNFLAFQEFCISPCDVRGMMMLSRIRGCIIIVYEIMATRVEIGSFNSLIHYALQCLQRRH